MIGKRKTNLLTKTYLKVSFVTFFLNFLILVQSSQSFINFKINNWELRKFSSGFPLFLLDFCIDQLLRKQIYNGLYRLLTIERN